ncbi:Mss4-like protein [Metschnikowia bicuspidata var. bicuspidata NRRL YB-4993]|uniref:Mss4-like protein n=1 Tax=Metschnikowia bicuspidata var. bicuspidata NRRL YB-4993 TaxID=869754 RepID=A0A1A0H6F7_9ASCO|nr:Mss4-like protein [Metschnikowia bicuspidata var. bicuspidata NRRL YB-4993]OBA19493.1 Mss4-like protein [Metschnikowia bicuspidata var. bicuspidata NRRL YB-4993]
MNLKLFEEVSPGLLRAILRCPFTGCHTRIIPLTSQLAATKVKIENAPQMTVDSEYFYAVGDAWDFDNIGVSRPSPDLEGKNVAPLAKVERLLICSECDKGPLGFAGFIAEGESDVKKLTYYLSCESVKFDETT